MQTTEAQGHRGELEISIIEPHGWNDPSLSLCASVVHPALVQTPDSLKSLQWA